MLLSHSASLAGADVCMRATLRSLSVNVTSLPNFVAVYLRNFYLLSKKVLFMVDAVVNIRAFNSSVLLVYNDLKKNSLYFYVNMSVLRL